MALTLYRKYRPQKFADITNQEHIKITLENQIKMDSVAHAYIFAGPRGVGKTTTARILSKAINCEKRKEKDSEPCNSCPACDEINAAKAMDIIEIDAASHTGVENVRENIIENVRFSPARLKNKVFIIDEAHMLSTSAFNALLKTLEEPPDHTVFIMATTEVHKIPSTIISRCQRFDFKKINSSEICKRLEYIVGEEKIKVDKEVLERIARLSEGCVRDSESLLGQILALDDKKVTVEQADLVLPRTNFEQVIKLLAAINTKDQKSGIELVNQLVHDGVDLKQFSSEVLEFSRELLLAKVMQSSAEIMVGWSADIQKTITTMLDSWTVADITRVIELMLSKQRDLKQTFPIQLPLELFVVEATRVEGGGGVVSTPTPKNNPKPPTLPAPTSDPKPKEKSAPAIKKPGNSNATIDKVINKWQDVVSELSETNHSLTLILGTAVPRAMNGNTLELAFKFKFHQEQVMSAKNKDAIELAMQKVFNETIILNGIIDESAEAPQEKISQETVANVMETFGGSVVE
jgi:DNA polymerase-3 subunit gamma/tau